MEEIVFPNQLRMLRRVRGRRMNELADLLNLSISALSKIEQGYRAFNRTYTIGYYLYSKLNKTSSKVKTLSESVNKILKFDNLNDSLFIPFKYLILLLENENNIALLDIVINYFQEKIKPNYNMLIDTVNCFSNNKLKERINNNLIYHMLDRGTRGIKTGSFDTNGIYTYTDGANPYEELFYYLSNNKELYQSLSIQDRENDPVKEYLYQEALDIFGIKLEIKYFKEEKNIDLETSKKLRYAKSIKRKENFKDIRGHIGIFEKSLEKFPVMDCKNITSLYVYPNVEDLGDNILTNFENLSNIRVDHRNKRYYSELQCLIERSTRQLIIGCKNSEIPGNVSSIAGNAWRGCAFIKKIVIPQNVLSIGPRAFTHCTSLETITLGTSLKSISEEVFKGCQSLKNIVFPSSLKTIGPRAFKDCYSLENIYISKSIDNIAQDAFYDCPKLKTINVDQINKVYYSDHNCLIKKETKYLVNSFNSWSVINNIKGIESYAWRSDSKIQKVHLPEGIIEIKKYAFDNCKYIEEISIPKSLQIIEPQAWCWNNSLSSIKKITVDKRNKVYSLINDSVIEKKTKSLIIATNTSKIPDMIETIKEGSFVGLKDIKNITIPKKVKNIEENSINRLPKLAAIEVEKDNLYYYSIDNCLIEKNNKRLILGCKNSIIPNDIKSIGQHAFDSCINLKVINLPSTLEKIEKYSFSDCISLRKIIIPNNNTLIQRSAFEGCINLEELYLPKSLISIEWYAFNNCPNLKKIYYEGSIKEFNEIKIGSHNEYLTECSIEYNYNMNS